MEAGNNADPMSQESYVWNGNNALDVADPSGFDGLFLDWAYTQGQGPFFHTYIEYDSNSGSKEFMDAYGSEGKVIGGDLLAIAATRGTKTPRATYYIR